MSKSNPKGNISIPEDPKIAAKIIQSAVTGGRKTMEEHRKLGAEIEKDMVFELLKQHLVESDKELKKIHDDYKSGKMLSGELKHLAVEKMNAFLEISPKSPIIAQIKPVNNKTSKDGIFVMNFLTPAVLMEESFIKLSKATALVSGPAKEELTEVGWRSVPASVLPIIIILSLKNSGLMNSLLSSLNKTFEMGI